MMNRTDRHFRYFMRTLTTRTRLYTQMLTARNLLDGDPEERLAFSEAEHPVALQLGGSDPEELAECASIGESFGYDEINLNLCCPSNRVQHGSFGVCMMGDPGRVADCIEAMDAAVDVPVTVKHRIGFDDRDSYEQLAEFVGIVSEAGCRHFTVHARKAWLDGLSPSENRNVPPLRHDDVHRLKSEFSHLFVETNGGIESLEEAKEHLEAGVDGVMIGRTAFDRPYVFADADREILGIDREPPTRREIAEAMMDYAEWWLSEGGRLEHVTRHMINLFSHQPGASTWRQRLAEGAQADDSGPEVIADALEAVASD
jgi:tRNA-dihydrouridine synthase A